MSGRYHPREQGDIGELSAMEWLAGIGASVYIPFGHSPDTDVVAEINRRLLRIQVKTSTVRGKGDRWTVALVTRGGNQSWSGVVKHFEHGRCDYLFAHVGDGRRWFIPATEVDGRSAIVLGGPKYAEYEVERGRPLLHSDPLPGEYPSGQRGGAVNAMALPSQVRILPPPSDPEEDVARPPPTGHTRLSTSHQLTIPRAPFVAAGIETGDHFRVEAVGKGRLAITRCDEVAAEHLGQLGLEPKARGRLDPSRPARPKSGR